MQELDDITLLREYAERDSEEAFATLVSRHVNKVYSVALRHTRNPHQAEEITQTVFVILAKKSRQLGKRVIISGWLYQTARLTAVTSIRSEIRRARREQEAHMQTLLNETESEVWPQIAPLLDAAMAGLSETDRHAVVLRFFDGKSMKEVGVALGASEDATKMRLSRAVEKLRMFFTKRGVVVPAAVLTAAISANSVQAAPVTLAKSVTAVAVAKGAAATTSTLTLIKGALKIMAWTKAKTAIVACATILLATGTTIIVKRDYFGEPQYQGVRLSAWLEKISAVSEARQTPMNDKDRALLLRAHDAVRQIGPDKAVPTLLSWANATNAIGHPPMPAYQLARIGFQTLGPIAQPAVGGLADLLTNKAPELRGNALVDLAAIGDGAAGALPFVLECLTNDPVPYIRYWAAGLVGKIGTNYPERVIPILVGLLNPTNDSTLRENSMASLAKFQTEADRVIPILAGLLNSTNDLDTRIYSMQSIARFRTGSKMAVPEIVTYLNDESPAIRMAATNALRGIDREAAIAAGVPMRASRGPRTQ